MDRDVGALKRRNKVQAKRGRREEWLLNVKRDSKTAREKMQWKEDI